MNSAPEEFSRESLEAQRDSMRGMIEGLAKKIRPTVERIETLERHVAAIEDTLAKLFPISGSSRVPRSSPSDEAEDGGIDYTDRAIQWLNGHKVDKITEGDFKSFLWALGINASRNSIRNAFRNLKSNGLVTVQPGDEGKGRRPTTYTVTRKKEAADTDGLTQEELEILGLV